MHTTHKKQETVIDLGREVFGMLAADPSIETRLEQVCRQAFLDHCKHADSSHDIFHTQRVLQNQKIIRLNEGGDGVILTPAALFHDVVCYPKHSEKSKFSRLESAEFAGSFLKTLDWFPQKKIAPVVQAIQACSFTANLAPKTLEAAILQDADLLESCGAIGLMRTFASVGTLGKVLFHPQDPFCRDRKPDPSRFGFDLIYTRLLKVAQRLNTDAAKIMAHDRIESIENFISSWQEEQSSDEHFQAHLENASERLKPGKGVGVKFSRRIFQDFD